jgi:hypothetical protein
VDVNVGARRARIARNLLRLSRAAGICCRRPFRQSGCSMDCFFVCGAPKSGTTWLQRILDAHREVACSGEGHFITRFSIPAANVVKAYNQALRVESADVYEGAPPYGPITQAEFDEMVRGFILGRLRSRSVEAGVRWFGDKTPRYTHQLDRLHQLFPAARIFHIVRDPRDVAVSRLAHAERTGLAGALTAGTEAHRANVDAAISGWVEAVEKVTAFAGAQPGLVHELRYQDLHDDPAGAIARLFAFLGVDSGPELVRRIAAETSFEAMSGRRPGQLDPTSFLRNGAPGDWRERLDPASAARVVEACGPLMRAKGVQL